MKKPVRMTRNREIEASHIGGEASAASEGFAFASTTSWRQSQLSAEASHCKQWREKLEEHQTLLAGVRRREDRCRGLQVRGWKERNKTQGWRRPRQVAMPGEASGDARPARGDENSWRAIEASSPLNGSPFSAEKKNLFFVPEQGSVIRS